MGTRRSNSFCAVSLSVTSRYNAGATTRPPTGFLAAPLLFSRQRQSSDGPVEVRTGAIEADWDKSLTATRNFSIPSCPGGASPSGRLPAKRQLMKVTTEIKHRSIVCSQKEIERKPALLGPGRVRRLPLFSFILIPRFFVSTKGGELTRATVLAFFRNY